MIEWISTQISDSSPIIAAAAGMVVTWFLLPIIISISHSKQLVDEPKGARKLHANLTPNLGGVAFYFALIIIFSLSGYAQQVWVPYFFGGMTVLFFSGVMDDVFLLSAWKKLVLQIVAVAALIFGGNVLITDLGGVFGLNAIPEWAGILLTGFTMIVVVNAYNLIDGIDGLAGSVGLIALLFFGGWFWYIGYMAHAVLAFTGAGTLVAFLRFNFEPASIFMGDTGSQVIGYLLAFFAVSFVKTGVTATGNIPFQNQIPILAVAILVVPLYDTLRVFTLRAIRRGSPFEPDRLHVHHQFLDMGFSDRVVCIIIAGINFAIIGLTLLLGELNVNALLAIVFFSSCILFPTIGLKRNILRKMGIMSASAQHIKTLERKYGLGSGSIPKNKATSKSAEQEKDLEQVAV